MERFCCLQIGIDWEGQLIKPELVETPSNLFVLDWEVRADGVADQSAKCAPSA